MESLLLKRVTCNKKQSSLLSVFHLQMGDVLMYLDMVQKAI